MSEFDEKLEFEQLAAAAWILLNEGPEGAANYYRWENGVVFVVRDKETAEAILAYLNGTLDQRVATNATPADA